MNRYKIIFQRFGGVLVLLFAIFFIPLTVRAEESTSNAAEGMQISPTRYEFKASRGDTKLLKITVTNVTASDLMYNSSISDFSAKDDETGSPYISTKDTLPDSVSIKNWISIIPNFKLGPHKSIEIEATVNIPENAEPGGHYGVVNFSGTAPELSGSVVGLSASAGVLVLITVDGDIKENANLKEFYSSHNNKQSWFFENGPITFVTRIKNNGNVHIKPTGNIQIHDIFGRLISTLGVNKPETQENISNVLPNSIRRFESELNKKWMFGRYTANLALSYGTKGQAMVNTISFWVIPYKLIIVGLLTLITLIYIFSRLIKVYNRRIIERHEKTNKNKTNK